MNTTTTDRTISVVVGLPVVVTYNATTGRWSVDVDLTELADSLEDVNPEFDGITEDDLAEITARVTRRPTSFVQGA